MRIIFNWALALWLVGVGTVPPAAADGTRGSAPAMASPAAAERAELVMGTLARVAILAGPATPAAFEAAFGALREVDATMSLYRPESTLVRVNAAAAGRAIPVEPALFDLLVRARELSFRTDGAFDPTVLPLLRAWGAYRELRHLAAGDPAAVGARGLVLDPVARTVQFRRPGMGIDLGGIAKGFALDRARRALVARGVARARLDLGGNLAFVGTGPGDAWRVAVRDPAASDRALGVLALPADGAVATSANYARDFAREGWRAHSHVYDPRTLRPVLAERAVTVWAPDATTADALATALLVLGADEADRVLAREPGAGALVITGGRGAVRTTLHGAPALAWRPAPEPRRAAADTVLLHHPPSEGSMR